jgi:hypothetical protein
LDPVAVARTYQADNPYTLSVDDLGVAAGVTVKTDTGGDGSWATTWAAGDFQLEPLNAASSGGAYAYQTITAIGARTFPVASRRPTVQVTGRFGWSAVPDEVREACILKAVNLWRRKDAPFGILGSPDFGGIRLSRFGDPDVTALLAPFQLAAVA